MNFGPRLDEYLILRRKRASWGRTPSKDEIRQAIASLAEPQSVSYTTFEIILALERTPLYTHLSLLLTGAHVLPSCIWLLKQHCNDQIRLFDYAYGYLCFQVMNLSIEVAKLAQVNSLPKFVQSVDRSSRGTRDKIIAEDLAVYVRKWESREFVPHGELLLPATKLLGWHINSSTGLATALSRIGGFTILDAVFLMVEIWKDRGKFLKCLRSAVQLQDYAGWCGILHLMHNTLVRMHGILQIHGQEFDETQHWETLLDLIQRYALCANEYEESTISYLLKNRPNTSRERHLLHAVDSADVDQIVDAYVAKAHQQPSIIYAHSTRLFAFTMTNCYLDESKFVDNITRIVEAALAASWTRFKMIDGTGLSMWTYFTDSVMNTHILVPVFSKYIEMRSTVLDIVVNENLLDLLGYFVLYPLTTHDKTFIENRWSWQSSHLRLLGQFIPIIGEHMETAPIEQSIALYCTWNKTAQSIQYHKAMKKNNSVHAKDYIATWEEAWYHIGEAIGRFPLLRCGYPRCSAPEGTGQLKCAGRLDEWYCSLRCQQAHWNHSASPHQQACIESMALEVARGLELPQLPYLYVPEDGEVTVVQNLKHGSS
ncbi:hypothetical protein B0J17DRAFT_682634 [Rhizoctonia solani]|nr:hypothetical protein B0J17DRAFT_682634 [Rhizoctonia solani]